MSYYNMHDTLAHAIRSLIMQTYPHWELILLDDGSTDNSEQVVNAFEDQRIRLYRDAVRRGLPARLNQGIALAKGAYVARMDADDVAFPERFAKQVRFLESHPEIDLLATAALLINADDEPVGVLPAGLDHDAICRRPWHGFPMSHPTWMGRIEWFLGHPYDELAIKAQDQSLLYRAYDSSRLASLPDVLLGYRYSELSVRKTLLGRYHYLRTIIVDGGIAHAFAGAISHGIAVLRDLIAVAFGIEGRVISSRVTPPDEKLLLQWEKIRLDMSRANETIYG